MRFHLSLAAILLTISASAFAEPSIDQIYKAAADGHMEQAQTMMREVLDAHPESAKAHFVHAQLLARQDDVEAARKELTRARELDNSESFAKPLSIEALRRSLAQPGAGGELPSQQSSLLLGLSLTILVALIGLAVWMAMRNRAARRAGAN